MRSSNRGVDYFLRDWHQAGGEAVPIKAIMELESFIADPSDYDDEEEQREWTPEEESRADETVKTNGPDS